METFSSCLHRAEFWRCFLTQHVESLSKIALSRADKRRICSIRRRNWNWPRLHSLVILLLMYSATKKVHIILHEAPLGTIVRGVYSLWCGTVATLWHRDIWTFGTWCIPSLRQHWIRTHSSFTDVVNMDFLQVGSGIETHTLSVRPEALTWYPSARSPTFGVLIGL